MCDKHACLFAGCKKDCILACIYVSFRGSALLIEKEFVAASKHVACPWLFPHYFPNEQDWLVHIDPVFVRHKIQVRDPSSGQAIEEHDLNDIAYFHPHRYVRTYVLCVYSIVVFSGR